MKFRWPTEKLLWPPTYPSVSCGVSDTWCDPFDGHMAYVKNCSYAGRKSPQIYTYTVVGIYITFDICKHYHWN
jgi:hypothetical protein